MLIVFRKRLSDDKIYFQEKYDIRVLWKIIYHAVSGLKSLLSNHIWNFKNRYTKL